MTAFLSHPLTLSVLGFLLVSLFGGVGWCIKTLVFVRVVLVGPDGENGLRGDMKSTKATVQELRDGVQAIHSRLAVKDVQDEQRDEKIEELRADFTDHVRGGSAPAVHPIAAGRRASTRGRD